MVKKRLAIFASGQGTNARCLIEYFRDHDRVEAVAVYCNKAQAGVVRVAQELGIPVFLFRRDDLYDKGRVLQQLQQQAIDWIVLAGFLWRIPETIIQHYPKRIVNIHPALLPKYGGKGMYGQYVHQAVLQAKEPESGITIHYVNEQYDAGEIIFQQRIAVHPDETPDSLAHRIQQLEHYYYPRIVEKLICQSVVA